MKGNVCQEVNKVVERGMRVAEVDRGLDAEHAGESEGVDKGFCFGLRIMQYEYEWSQSVL